MGRVCRSLYEKCLGMFRMALEGMIGEMNNDGLGGEARQAYRLRLPGVWRQPASQRYQY